MSNTINSHQAVTILSGAALSDAVDFRQFFGLTAMVYIPAWTSASLGFQVSNDGGTYTALRNTFGSLVEVTGIQTAAAGWYALPTELNGASFFKLWSETSGSGVNQASDRACLVMAKG